MSNFGVADSDTFWHVRNGSDILSTRSIPRADVYSWTARGEPYAYYSWLAEVGMALLQRAGGWRLLVLAKALACALLFLLLAWSCRVRGGRGLAVPWALLYGLLLARFRLYERPEILTLLLVVLFDALAVRWLDRGRRWILFVLPPLAALWANLHPYVVFGIGVLGAHAAGAWLGRRLRRPDDAGEGNPLRLAASAAACAVASLLNPYGWRIYAPALKLVLPGPIAELPFREWLPPSFEDFRLFYILAIASGALMLVTCTRARIADALLWSGTFFLALLSLRNIGLFALLSAPIVARHLAIAAQRPLPLPRRLPAVPGRLAGFASRLTAGRLRPWLPRLHALLLALLVVFCAATLLSPDASLLHQDQSRHYRFGAGLAHDSAPVAAVEFLESRGLEGPLYNSLAFGGYLIWRSWPRLQVFWDGRQMIYERLFAELRDSTPGETLRRHSIRTGLVWYRDPAWVRAFRDSPDHALVFFDDLALLFARGDDLAARHGALRPFLLLRPEDLSMGWMQPASLPAVLEEARRAVRESPDCGRAWMILGAALRRSGDRAESAGAYDRAVAIDPTQPAYLNNRGIARLELGDAEAALRDFRRAARLDPGDAPGHFNSALALLRLGREGAALRALRRAVRLDPALRERLPPRLRDLDP